MDDDTIRTLFDSLDTEPRPGFIATLRRRMEQEWANETTPAAVRHQRDDRLVPVELDVPTHARPVDRQRRLRRDVAIVLTTAAAMLAALILVVRTRNEVTPVDSPVTAGPTTSAAPSLPATTVLPAVEELGGRLRATIPVENTADSIAVTDDAVWVSGWDGTTVSRIDAHTNAVTTVDVGVAGARVAAGEGGVWVGVDGGRLLRLDSDSGELIATIDTAPQPTTGGGSAPLPSTGDGAVWVQHLTNGVVSRVDPQTNEVTATVDLTTAGTVGAEGIVIADGLVWVNTCSGPVSIDPQTLTVSEPIALDGCGNSIGFSDGSLWVGLPGPRTARIDPGDREVEVILDIGPVDDAPFLATADGAVWRPLTTSTIARIDTATNTVSEILDLDRGGQVAGFAVGHGSLWAGDYSGRSVLRIDQ